MKRLVSGSTEDFAGFLRNITPDRQQLVDDFNDTAADYPTTQCIHALFEQQAASTPEAIALVFENSELSYAELNAQANRLARHLIGMGIRPDERVAICVERSPAMVIGLLAILKAGGAYVPLDPSYPAERLAFMLADSAPRVLLTQHALLPALQPLPESLPVLMLDDAASWQHLDGSDPDPVELGLTPEHLAYVIYTSGSTGMPKGVAMAQAPLLNLIRWHQDAASRLQAPERTLQFAALGFDVAFQEIFSTLCSGHSLVLMQAAIRQEPHELLALLREQRIERLFLPFAALQAVAEAALHFGDDLPLLKNVITAGEQLRINPAIQRFISASPARRLHNHYGPTETHVVTAFTLSDTPADWPALPPIGRPIANTRIYILDAHGEPVSIGVAGEIHIGGAQVARGYLNRPELTAERFVRDPFSSLQHARMYRTGDLARWCADGAIEFIGRNDDQVKIRGFRIELGEIEAQLAQVSGVREVAVLAREDSPGDKRLVAYLSGEADPAALREHLAARLPSYMIPAAYVRLSALPLTPNGKLDRKALPAPGADAFVQSEYEAPRGEIEIALAALWSELLGIERIGRQDDFFALGGHSLMAVTLIERMRRHGWQLQVLSLFTSPTLAALAARVTNVSAIQVPSNLIAPGCTRITPELLPLVSLSQQEIDAVVATVPAGAANVQDIYPLAPLQEGILFHHLMDPEHDTYLMPILLTFDHRQRLDSFLLALQSVIDRHDILRTAIAWEGLGEPVQVVWREATLPVQELHIEDADVAQALLDRFAPGRTRIDVRQAPLLRAHAAHDASQDRWMLMLLNHHLCNDQTTLKLIFEEVQSHLSGQQHQLPAPLPFRDFIAQARLGMSREEHENFFRQMLGDVTEPTAPFGVLDVHNDGTRIGQARLQLDATLARRLRAHARGLGVNAASFFHLAWAHVLGCTSARDDVVFGSVLFGRMQAGLGADRALGMFVNTLPLRVRLDGRPLRQALRDTHAQLAQLMHHEQAPLSLAQRCSAVRHPTPLFTTLLNYRHSLDSGDVQQGFALDGIDIIGGDERTNYPFGLSIDDLGGEGFKLDMQAVEPIGAARLAEFMRTALHKLVQTLDEAPETPVRALQVLPESERWQLLHDFNDTSADYPSGQCIHALFEQQAASSPAAVALVFENSELSYAELNTQANRLARHLIGMGVKPDERVAICVERSPAMVIGLLAILKAGGAYVPLDPSYPAERLAFMLADSAPRVLLTGHALLPLLQPLQPLPASLPVILLDDAASWQHLDGANPDPAELGLTPAHLAYIIYTSGSTGQPKGVMVEHRNIVNESVAQGRRYGLRGDDRVLQFVATAFDVCIEDVLCALSHGAAVVLRTEAWLADPEAFLRHCAAAGVTSMNLPTQFWQTHMLDAALPMSLRRIVIGGEAASEPALQRWFARAGHRPVLFNAYGPTETTVCATLHECRALEFPVPIGRPIANTRIYILDAHGAPVPVGVPGEIHIGGAQVARGYLNRPELTAERFVRDPFGTAGRMYKTGDLGRWRADGAIEFLCRNDDQVKIRGFRIELGEIEAQLAQAPGVRDVAVIAREDSPGDKRLVAYLSGEADPAALREHLAARLPSYMIPAAYVLLPALPLTPNGKLDRKALPAPEAEAFVQSEYEAPHGEIEIALAALWRELLGIERIGRRDDFFALGGHSLMAVTLIERMRRHGWQLQVRSLFTSPTLAALAACIKNVGEVDVPANLITPGCTRITPELLPLVSLSQQEIDAVVATVPAGAANVQDIYPLAPLQEGILFHHLLDPERDAYLMPMLLAFDNRQRLDSFLLALQSVIDRHDSLRTAIAWEGLGEPVQVVWRQAELPVQELDISGDDVAQTLLERFAPGRSRIDMRQAPLLRAHAAHDASQGRWLLMLLTHHMCNDHTTLDLTFGEVQAHLRGQQHLLPAPVPFRDFIAQARLGMSREEHENFFRQMLGDVTEPTAPFGVLDVHNDGSRIDQACLQLDATLAQRLRAHARGLGVNAASMFHLAWAQVLGCTSARDDVVFGSVLFGRMQAGLGADRALGMFINTLPLRVRLDDTPLRQAVRDTHAQLAQLLHHEQAPLSLAQRCSAVAHPAPLFTALLNYRHGQDSGDAQQGFALDGIEIIGGDERTNYPLTLSIDDLGSNGFVLNMQVVEPIGAARLTEFMRAALHKLVQTLDEAPETPVRALRVLPEAERQQLLQFNDTATVYPSGQCIHALFEQQAASTPAAVALVFEDQELSYAELNAQANRLARHLIGMGIRPDERVAICVERSPAMVVGLLAILKAGGAYVPLDPSYPAERLAFMLADGAPRVLLTQHALLPLLQPLPESLSVLMLEDGAPWQHLDGSNPDSAELGLTPEHLAYVIYTSGSTGMPKGVAMAQAPLLNLIRWHQDAASRLQAPERTLQFAALGFDVAFQEIFSTLCSGHSLVLMQAAIRQEPHELLALLREQRIERLFLPFAALQAVAEAALHFGDDLPLLKNVITAGEQLRINPAIQRFISASPARRLHNHYGPTETHVVTAFTLSDTPADWPALPPIGRPIANTRIYILDAHGEPTPVGVPGEIHISGAQVARGYLNRPELTAERFVRDPFSVAGRMYRTGDLGRWCADGAIEFIGRNDDQVKIRGFRIEPGEIEAQLAQAPGVRDVAVLAREDSPGDKRLVAYLTGETDAAVLREYLAARLPPYMIPAAYVRLSALPLTPNGKLDRKALPAPEADAFVQSAYEAPRGEIEIALAALWSELLGIERIGRRDDFFALGGHSLMAVQLTSRVRSRLGAEVAIAKLFAHPTLAAFAPHVSSSAASEMPPIVATQRPHPLPLSFAQQRLWFLAQLDARAGEAYHIPMGVRLTGTLDSAALQASLDRLVARHEVLRTRFVAHDGSPAQYIDPPHGGFALAQVDLRDHPSPEAELQRLGAVEASAPFDFEQGPLIRGCLLRLAEHEHVLLMTMHHIISDGWSLGVLSKEFGVLYAALSQGQPDPLPPLSLQYADYTLWQRRYLEGPLLERQLDFWRTYLQGAPALLELPTDRARPPVQSYRGRSVPLVLPAALSTALRQFSQRHGCTLFMTLLAGWSILLSRLSGQTDIVVGTPVANRHSSEVESLIGFFVNTLALRVSLEDNPSVAQVIANIKGLTLQAYTHQDLPFEQVVEALQPSRNLSYNPVFQVMLALNNTPGSEDIALSGLGMKPVEFPFTSTQFDLSLMLAETGDTISGDLAFATDLFERGTIERLAEHLHVVLEAMIREEQQGVEQLPLLNEQQRQKLVQFNDTATDYPSGQCIHALFEQQAASTPAAVALVFEDQELSYAELNAQANRLARHLIGMGIRPDERVAICVERSPAMVVGLLAILKAGGAYVPLDPSYPAERLAFMLADSAPRVLLTQHALLPLLQPLPESLSVLMLEDSAPWQHLDGSNPDSAELGLTPEHLAYVIYTSGSTGMPKGVAMAQAPLLNLIRWHQDAASRLQAPERTLQFAALGFDVAFQEIFSTLCSGHSLVLMQAAIRQEPHELLALLREQRIERLFLPFAALQAVAEAALHFGDDLPLLKNVITAGEQLRINPAIQRFICASPARRLHNHYGPTETHVVTAFTLSDTPADWPALPPIGRPIANTRIYILDAHGEPTPVGVPGEIHIGGAQVANGYLNRPELTAERFVRDPFSVAGRMYRTGDLGRWCADGAIEFIGRNDDQVKIRGFRIEPGEIEAQLAQAPGVRDVAVLAREDSPGDKRLVAYLTGEADAAVLREYLAARLPPYMIPAAYVRLSALPLTPNGKLDRKALPAPEANAFVQSAYEAPRGEIEIALAALWSELLGIERIGRRDDFFALGGHSLMAVQLTSRVRSRLGAEVAIAKLFAHPTLAAFAPHVSSSAASEMPPIVATQRPHPLPLSFAQQRLWFLAQLDARAGEAYHIPMGVRLSGPLDSAVLQASLDRLVARHEVLRTRFVAHDGSPAQYIDPPHGGFALAQVDLRDHPSPEAELQRLGAVEASASFDFEQGPLIRGCLLRLAEHEHVLLMTMHHIISDGWSLGVLSKEFGILYAALSQGQPDPLPPLPLQYADYTLWQRRYLEGPLLERQLDFWRTYLQGAPALLELPTDRARPPVQSYRGRSVPLVLPAALSTALRQFSQRHGCTLFMTLLAGWSILLSRLSGQTDIVVGTPVANRHSSEVESLIGFFVNTLALRVSLEDNPSVAQVIANIKGLTLQAYTHQDLPFEQVVEALQPSRNLSYNPVFQVMLALNNTPGSEDIALSGLGMKPVEFPFTSTQFDLSLMLAETGDTISGDLAFATDLFERGTIERLAEHLHVVLEAMIREEQQGVEQLPLLNEQQRQKLVQFNDTATDYPSGQCIHALFEQQAASTPAAVALVFEDQELSYAELNAQANRLARHLIGMGIRPDERVAICVERSPAMVIGLLAILKAGGAYVPLDPGYPAERLDFMLADSAPRVLLTQHALLPLLQPLPESLSVLMLEDSAPWQHLDGSNPDPVELGLTPEHLAYVIYTSGSTGMPKGVMNEHHAVVNRLQWMQQAYALQANESVLQKTPFSFDVSVWEFFWPLLVGARLVLARPQGHQDPEYLCALIASHAITTVHFVPSMLQIFLEHPHASACTSLRRVVCSGEALATAPAQRAAEVLPWAGLYNLYGPTEAAVDVTAYTCDPSSPRHAGGSVPIGRPIANTTIHILDAHGKPVPIGVAGEIHIGGVQVARGYLNRPELTAERFVRDPFSAAGRMYKTGDLGRWCADGVIEFLGRNDHQVKIRGFRIELGEIEAQLAQASGVREVAVIAREDSPGDKRLVAYLAGEADTAALREYLTARLPSHMIPAAYVRLSALPLTPNGKLDRKALPAPETEAFVQSVYEAPHGEIEIALAALWRELLGIERIGRQDDFFALGGHSLMAVTLIERMRRHGWQLQVRSLFTSPTLAALAACVENVRSVEVPPNLIVPGCTRITPELLPLVSLSQQEIDAVVATVPAGAANVQDIYPLAPLQEGILFHHLLDPERDTYLMPILLTFDHRQRLESFLLALQSVIDRHDILRTAIAWEGLNEPVQVVWREATLPVQELRMEEGDVAQALLDRFAPGRTRIDVRQAPLLRADVAQDASHDRWLLVLRIHHLVDDNTSLKLVLQEVQSHLSGQQHQLPAPLPFRDFIAQARLGMSREEHENFFRQMLGDVTEPTAPFGVLEVHNDGTRIGQARLQLDATLAQRLRAHARGLGVNAASFFHLAWAHVLGCTSARDDVVFGSVLFGRMQAGLGADRALGMFINTLPLRVRLDGTPLRQALRDTHAQLAQLMHHEQAPLSLAQRCSAVRHPTPLFTTLLNYRHSQDSTDTQQGFALDGIDIIGGDERTNYPFGLSIDDLGADGFELDMQAVEPIGAARLGEFMRTALHKLVQTLDEAPETPLRAVQVLPESERWQLLHDFNDTSADYPSGQCIHALFEQQAASTPAAVALAFEDQELSYAELNAQANRLAHHLIGMGIRPDERVAICVERSPAMVVGLLAILKAGGAYVPLDPSYPAERLALMLADSAPRVLLTQHALLPALQPLPESLPVLMLDDAASWQHLDGANPDPVELGLTPAHLAYVIYTSGSTGQPKGVMVEHRNIVNESVAQGRRYGLRGDDRVLQFVATAFDVCIEDALCALSHGAAVVLRTEAWLADPEAFWRHCAAAGVTSMNLPTQFWQTHMLDAALPMSLRRIVIGGEAASEPALQRWFARAGHRPVLFNAYGPTETTVCATLHECRALEFPVPIGRPIANTRIYILDAHGAPVPVGVPGEIHIGGAQVARGYLNRPELTAERFVRDPFGTAGRMYKTGDLGRWRADGAIEFLGRNDDQVKIRGFRIELGEIEAQLVQAPGVRDVAVIAREDSPGDKRLVAYLSGEADPAALREHLAARLPSYMIPAAYVLLPALPLTPNGKLDRKALPAPEAEAFVQSVYEAPQGEIEIALAALWRELLGIERIGRRDDFFALGGHSLMAVRLVDACRKSGFTLSIAALFAHPSLEGLSACIRDRSAMEDKPVLLKTAATGRPLFLLPAVSGQAFPYVPLAAHIDLDIPIYGLVGPQRLPEASHTFQAAAARYVRIIREVQSRGPYRLAGWSLGGMMAYEVASQLIGEDEEVEYLALFDTQLLDPAKRHASAMRELSDIEWVLMNIATSEDDEKSLRQRIAHLPAGASLSDQIRVCKDSGLTRNTLFNLDLEFIEQWLPHWRKTQESMLEYVAQPISARLHLFAAQQTVDTGGDQRSVLGWEALLSRAQIERTLIPGDHDSMMQTPGVESLGRAVAATLRSSGRVVGG